MTQSETRTQKEQDLLKHDYAAPCPDCGAVVFEWQDSCDGCDPVDEPATEQASLPGQ